LSKSKPKAKTKPKKPVAAPASRPTKPPPTGARAKPKAKAKNSQTPDTAATPNWRERETFTRVKSELEAAVSASLNSSTQPNLPNNNTGSSYYSNANKGQGNYYLMQATLGTAVPLWVILIKERNGPDKTDYERIREFDALIAGPGGEDLLFKSKVPGCTASFFNQLAYAVKSNYLSNG
jgi:hypothetical protein